MAPSEEGINDLLEWCKSKRYDPTGENDANDNDRSYGCYLKEPRGPGKKTTEKIHGHRHGNSSHASFEGHGGIRFKPTNLEFEDIERDGERIEIETRSSTYSVEPL